MPDQDISHQLQHQLQHAAERKAMLAIQTGNSKAFLGRAINGEVLDVSDHQGILNYEPTELVITARSGTPLQSLEQTLHDNNQMLAFEPPHFGTTASLGGTIACNLSGPRRPHAGAARDFVLGTRILNGKGDMLHFGGEVMKNVAGYDLSRLMAGAMGTLGVLLEISLKVLPRPESECTLAQQIPIDRALDQLHTWALQPLPVSATAYLDGTLFIRLSGTPGAVKAAMSTIGGGEVKKGDQFWHELKEHKLRFFRTDKPIWRLSLASDTPPVDLPGDWLYEWAGAQRWLAADLTAQVVQRAAADAGGNATLYRNHGEQRDQVFQPLPSGLARIHQQLKRALDPHGILNPGRLYPDL